MKLLTGVALATGLALAGNASAAVTVDLWIVNNYSNPSTSNELQANEASVPGGLADATFTYSGPINWVNNAPNNGGDTSLNTFGQFLSPTQLAAITGYSSPSGNFATLADLEGQSLSTEGTTLQAFFRITGSYNQGPASAGSISHDDGASVYIDGNAVVSAAGWTSEDTNDFTAPGGSHGFVIDYVEANGSPSDLIFTTGAVPEPATWAMMLAGFGGMGAAMRNKRRNRVASAA
jgi:hypothetical protein